MMGRRVAAALLGMILGVVGGVCAFPSHTLDTGAPTERIGL